MSDKTVPSGDIFRILAEQSPKAILIKKCGKGPALGISTDISELKRTQDELQKAATILRDQKKALQDKNTALKEIMAQIEEEKIRIKRQITINANKLIFPILKRLKSKVLPSKKRYVELLELNIKELVSKFGIEMTSGKNALSPRELEICNMIRGGFSSKEIAETLHLSIRTVDTHRNRIRKKLLITSKNINLTTHLQTITCDSTLIP